MAQRVTGRRTVTKTARAKADVNRAEMGTSGLKRSYGRVDEEFLRELRGTQGIKVYREMRENDDIVGAVLFAIQYLIRQVKWTVNPGGTSPEANERAAFIRTALFEDMSFTWEDTLTEILTMLVYGWAYLEVVYKIRGGESDDPAMKSRFTDGRIGWRKWALRAQTTLDRWAFDEDGSGGIRGMWQTQEKGSAVLVPIEKALLFRTTTERNNPEGRSLLRSAYRAWYFKKNMQQLEGIGAERDLAGYPYISVEGDDAPDIWDANDPDMVTLKASLETIIKSIRRDDQEGAILPGWAKLQLLSAPSRRQFDVGAVITRYDTRIAMTVLADFVLIGHDAVGSKALSVSKVDLFGTAMDGIVGSISSVVNRYAIPALLKVNGLPMDEQPTLSGAHVLGVDLAGLGEFIGKLTSAGAAIFPNQRLEAHLLAEADLPSDVVSVEEA